MNGSRGNVEVAVGSTEDKDENAGIEKTGKHINAAIVLKVWLAASKIVPAKEGAYANWTATTNGDAAADVLASVAKASSLLLYGTIMPSRKTKKT